MGAVDVYSRRVSPMASQATSNPLPETANTNLRTPNTTAPYVYVSESLQPPRPTPYILDNQSHANALITLFWVHTVSAHVGKATVSELLCQEAVARPRLHKPKHYED